MNKEIERLIIKYISKSITRIELNYLSKWIEDDNRDIFEEYLKVNYALDYNCSTFDSSNVEKIITQKIDAEAKKRRSARNFGYAAAIITAFFAIASLIYFNSPKEAASVQIVQQTPIIPGSEKAVLTLENGEQLALGNGSTLNIDKIYSDDEKLVYSENITGEKKLAYNYLTVPKAGQFFVQLSDGTKVWLNSDSRLKYPKSFTKGEDRVVELEYGEAFFDVSPSILHQNSKFKILSSQQNIEVLGTQFNVRAYKNEMASYTTLVEGKVLVHNGTETKKLKPGEQAEISPEHDILVQEVNLHDVISWKSGTFSFKGTSLKEITNVLSRWYDVEFIFEHQEMENVRFNGSFRKNQQLDKILSIIQNTNYISSYEIKNRTVRLR